MDQRAGMAVHAGFAKYACGRRHGALGCTRGAASRGDAGVGVVTGRAFNGQTLVQPVSLKRDELSLNRFGIPKSVDF